MDDNLDTWEGVTKTSLEIQINLVEKALWEGVLTWLGPACTPCQIRLTPTLPGATNTAHRATQKELAEECHMKPALSGSTRRVPLAHQQQTALVNNCNGPKKRANWEVG